MKKIILFLVPFSISMGLHSQTENSLNSSKTRYNPTDISYYETLGKQAQESAKNKAVFIFDSSNSLRVNAKEYLNNTEDEEFKTELKSILKYLEVVLSNNTMSLKTADWYFKTAEKKLNKAVKSYNKRLKKFKVQEDPSSIETTNNTAVAATTKN